MRAHHARPVHGFTLIDVLVLITLLGIVAGSVVAMFTRMAGQSAELMRTRQAIAVAQSLINEVRMMPFTNCDRNATGCGPAIEAVIPGPETGESRYHGVPLNFSASFDNVNDYHNLVQPSAACAGICDIKGTLLNPAGSALEGCTSRTTVATQALAALPAAPIPAADGLLITVTVTCPGVPSPVVLQGIRTRHAPSAH